MPYVSSYGKEIRTLVRTCEDGVAVQLLPLNVRAQLAGHSLGEKFSSVHAVQQNGGDRGGRLLRKL